MSKKILALTDFITAHDAAQILTLKHGRRIDPDYIHKIKDVRFVKLNKTSKLYNRADLEKVTIRKRSI